jgi:IS5 family transposase
MRQKDVDFTQTRINLRGAITMRKAFDRQGRLDCSPVLAVRLNMDCRDEIVPILKALQHIYSQPALRDSILRALARDVNRTSSSRRGREGMDYWQILVLAAVRLGCDLDYDKLQDLAEQHRALRQIMGIGDWDEQVSFDWRRIRDNVTKIRPETIEKINHLIVEAGHKVAPQAVQTVRADSFVVETNIHYPTESSLIRDGMRKMLTIAAALASLLGLDGWRQSKHLFRKTRRLARRIERIAARKGAGYQERLKPLYRQLLSLTETVLRRAEELRTAAKTAGGIDPQAQALDDELAVFIERTRHVCGTARRRVLEGEKVSNEDKLFSLFEPHTQLYKRGKAGEPIQFGRQLLIYEDGAGFITHAYLMPRDADDRDVVIKQTRKLQKRLGGRIRRASFDRGFHSPENQEQLREIIAHPCLPMPGSRQAAQQDEEATLDFHQARQSHSGVESAIGALQAGNGLTRCRDRTEDGFCRYLHLGVLGRNLHVLGKLLIAAEDADALSAQSRRKAA